MIFVIQWWAVLSVTLLFCGISDGQVDRSMDILRTSDTKDFVDPHSFYYNKHTQMEVKSETGVISSESIREKQPQPNEKCSKIFNECVNRHKNEIPDELFSRRLINRLLSVAKFEESDYSITGTISIEITSSEMQRLRNFGHGKASIKDVDPIIANIFKTPKQDIFFDVYTFIRLFMQNTLIYKEVVLTIMVVVYMSWVILTMKWNLRKLLFIMMLVIILASFVITWLQLLKNAEIKLAVKQTQYIDIPIECRPSEMSWWDSIRTLFRSPGNCQKYYEARMENPFLQVTPAQAFSHMIATCVFEPVTLAGNAMNNFVDGATDSLWEPFRTTVRLLLQVLLIVLGIVLIVCLTGGSLRGGLGPFSIFSLGRASDHRETRHITSSKEKREPIEVILNLKVSSNAEIQPLGINNTVCTCPAIVPASADVTPPAEDNEILIIESSKNESGIENEPKKLSLSLNDCDHAGCDSNVLPSSASQSSEELVKD